MNNILTFSGLNHKHQENVNVEAAFIGLLDKYCDQEDSVKPLSNSFFYRIERLNAKALEAKERQESVLLED
jgi:hypothetical protein